MGNACDTYYTYEEQNQLNIAHAHKPELNTGFLQITHNSASRRSKKTLMTSSAHSK